MHNGNKNINWTIVHSRKVKGEDDKGNKWEGLAIVKKGKIHYIEMACKVK